MNTFDFSKTSIFAFVTPQALQDLKNDLLDGAAMLISIDGSYKFLLDKDEFIAGRSEGSDIFLNDTTVSRRHAKIYRSGSQYAIKDLGSLNGLYINSKLAVEHILQDMDEIQIGRFKFIFISKNQ